MIPVHIACRWLACWLGMLIAGRSCLGQQIGVAPPPQLALPAEQLIMEQAEELSRAGQSSEALQLLEKLFDEAEQRLVPAAEQGAAATLRTQRYLPLAAWVRQRTTALLQQDPEAAEAFDARYRSQALPALEQLQASKDLGAANRLALRYGGTQWGKQFQLLLCDLYLEQGWGVAAAQATQLLTPAARLSLPSPPAAPADPAPRPAGSLTAAYVWQQLAAAQPAEVREQLWEALFATPEATQDPGLMAQAARRMLLAAALNPRALDLEAIAPWADQLAERLPAEHTSDLRQTLQQIPQWSPLSAAERGWDSFTAAAESGPTRWLSTEAPPAAAAHPPTRPLQFIDWPAWSQRLEKFAASGDRGPASQPRVAETERNLLAYYPSVQAGKVYVNELTRIMAYELGSGQPWPDARGGLPLFDSHVSAAAYLPLGQPMLGVARGVVTIAGDSLYARMGSPITGRLQSRTRPAGDSASYLIGLDLSRQGSLHRGFPLHLNAAEFENAEFEGPPVVWGDLLIVAIAQRDHGGLRRSVAAFQRHDGQLIWRSGTLAAGNVVGAERANLLAHQQLTLAGGRLYYSTHLGSIACLDPLSGATQWLVQYSTPSENLEFPRPDRYRYRDLCGCLVTGGLVICAPQDAPEIFALDALTGELVWSTDDTSVADAVQLLGTHGNSLLVSGDRLVWLDRQTGRVQAGFPGRTTPLLAGALPNPRGLGRGIIAEGCVWWPTAGEILVFPASLNQSTTSQGVPALLDRLPLQPGGSWGGNVLIVDGTLLVATPSRLMAYPAPPPAAAPAGAQLP